MSTQKPYLAALTLRVSLIFVTSKGARLDSGTSPPREVEVEQGDISSMLGSMHLDRLCEA
jgi:hypothetical protein